MSTLLRVDAIEVGYGDLTAVGDVSLEVREGETVALIGANGAGKTTTLRAVSGLLPLRRGRIEFEGQRLDGLTSAQIVARGIAHVPEGRQLFPTMTVLENLELGARTRAARAGRAESLAGVFDLFPRLRERRGQLAGTLSGGEQQMVAIGRGLMARPALLMVDEPFLGLAPRVIEQIAEVLTAINRERGITVVFIEQNVELALRLADRGYILESGRSILTGSSAELLRSAEVKRIFLGDIAL
jgi:branched-chain amino acid transport system ATP-binding protein